MMGEGPAPEQTDLGQSPRNPWARMRKMLDLLAAGHLHDAQRCLEGVRYHPALPREAFEVYAARIQAARDAAQRSMPINLPCDYTAATGSRLRLAFRQVRAGDLPAVPYPSGMALPQHAGAQNDTTFLRAAATALAPAYAQYRPKVDVFLAAGAATDVRALAAVLAAQTGEMDVRLSVFGAQAAGLPPALPARSLADPFPGAVSVEMMRETLMQTDADITVFLSGNVVLDKGFLQRAWFLAQVSDRVVQALVPQRKEGLLTGWHLAEAITRSHRPDREVLGLNFVVPTALLRLSGLPEARFSSSTLAARELCWRMLLKGAWFAPLAVPMLDPVCDAAAQDADSKLYEGLCPAARASGQGGTFERPKVDVYIPAYNASRYICRAVDSVLAQDFQDLRVCIADDGSTDGTYALLQRTYGDDARVRLSTGPNGGIGHASNRAIAMGSAPYIGQLDADDCLKPGAVRKLVAWLDAHPQTACVYGACERIDAQGVYIKNEFNWPVFSREKMMMTSIAHHFRMFRRTSFERTTGFREDIANAVDYDLLLKLAETGEFHHLDDILYQRRWHGANTSDVHERMQTANTHLAQYEALRRLGLERFWQVHIADPARPREVGYKRRADVTPVLFWPDRTAHDPAQHLMYGTLGAQFEVCVGTIDAAMEQLDLHPPPAGLVFHLHGMPPLVPAAMVDFTSKLTRFVQGGGRLVWTVPQGHDFTPDLKDVCNVIACLADCLHFHSAAAVKLCGFTVAQDKVRIAPQGHYIGAYPDFISRAQARAELGIAATREMVLPVGAWGAQDHRAPLLDLPAAVQARLWTVDHRPDDMELQVFMRAADVALCPDDPAAVLLALGFGLPIVAPSGGVVQDLLGECAAGMLYDVSDGPAGVAQAVQFLLERRMSDGAEAVARAALQSARARGWPDFAPILEP